MDTSGFKTQTYRNMKKQTKKPECEKSSTGKHKWKKVEEDRTRKDDWGCVPGTYCIHCGERKKT